MLRFVPPFLAAAALVAPGAAQQKGAAGDDTAWAPHRATRMLYAGWKDGSREKAFVPFLEAWFDRVGSISLEALSPETAADYDVVIADWCSQYGNDGYPKRENSLFGAKVDMPPGFAKPVIAMDYVSTNLRGGYKLDWL